MSGVCLESNCTNYLSHAAGQLFSASFILLNTANCLINDEWPKDSTHDLNDLNFDYIVVGAGTAGSIVATRLSEDANRRVLLIEAGGDPPFESQVPMFAKYIYGTKNDWQYETENDDHSCQGMVGCKCKYLSGKTLGGSSCSNEILYIRGNPKDYDDIESSGNYGWNFNNTLKYFKKSENLLLSSFPSECKDDLKIYHGLDGPVGVKRLVVKNPIGDVLIKAYNDVGIDELADVNGRKQNGVVKALGTIRDGKRESTARSFLLLTKNRTNLVILKNAQVLRIKFDRNRANAVKLKLGNGTVIRAHIKREVILSTGAVVTPQILMLSGIGPSTHLRHHNISVISDLCVGENFHDQTRFPVIVTLNQGFLPKSQKLEGMDVVEYLAFQSGYYAELDLAGLTAFTNIDNEENPQPNIQFNHRFFNVKSKDLKNFCEIENTYNEQIKKSIYSLNENSEILIVFVTLLNQESRGSINLNTKSINDKPKIYANYFSENNDINRIVKAIKLVEQMVYTSISFKNVGARIPRISIDKCNSSIFRSDEYWKCAILQMGTSNNQPMGTAKMGPSSDPSAVVNGNLRVHGFKNLRVVDSSIVPDRISGNINAAVMMIAEKASAIIKRHNKKKKIIKKVIVI